MLTNCRDYFDGALIFGFIFIVFFYLQVSFNDSVAEYARDKLNPAMVRRRLSIVSNDSNGEPQPPPNLARRRSSVRGIAASFLLARRASRHNIFPKTTPKEPKVVKENTYKMVPDDETGFRCSKVEQVVSTVLESQLSDMTYDPDRCSKVTTHLSNMIKDRVKNMGFERYKYVVTVLLGQCNDQSLHIASRSVWNDKTDTVATASYQNDSLMAVANVYGIYFE